MRFQIEKLFWPAGARRVWRTKTSTVIKLWKIEGPRPGFTADIVRVLRIQRRLASADR
jgi:hypothetical protein